MPEAEYAAFLRYKEMKDKYDYLQTFSSDSKEDIALTLAVFGAFTEGLQLFASFAILLNFPRFNKMKGMGQIVSWSVRDETLHTFSIIRLFRTFVAENPEIWSEDFQRKVYRACETIVTHEDAFIDLAFEMGGVEGLDAPEVKDYIRYIADRRLGQLGLQPIYRVDGQSPALARRHAERRRAHQLLREPGDRVLPGGDGRQLGRRLGRGGWGLARSDPPLDASARPVSRRGFLFAPDRRPAGPTAAAGSGAALTPRPCITEVSPPGQAVFRRQPHLMGDRRHPYLVPHEARWNGMSAGKRTVLQILTSPKPSDGASAVCSHPRGLSVQVWAERRATAFWIAFGLLWQDLPVAKAPAMGLPAPASNAARKG